MNYHILDATSIIIIIPVSAVILAVIASSAAASATVVDQRSFEFVRKKEVRNPNS